MKLNDKKVEKVHAILDGIDIGPADSALADAVAGTVLNAKLIKAARKEFAAIVKALDKAIAIVAPAPAE